MGSVVAAITVWTCVLQVRHSDKPGDDHDGEEDEDEEGAEDDDSHVHVFLSLQWSEVVRKVGTEKKFCESSSALLCAHG